MLAGLCFQLATLLVAVLKGVVSLRLLSGQGPVFYAALSQFIVMATFFGAVLSLQLDAATVRFAADGQRPLARILGGHLACVALVGLVLVLVMLAWGDQLSPWVFDVPGWRWPMVLAVTSSTQTALWLVLLSSLQARSRFRFMASLQTAQYLLQLLAIAVSVRWGNPLAVMAALVLGDGLLLLVLMVLIVRDTGIGRPDRAYLHQALRFAWPLMVSYFLTWLIHASGRFLQVKVHGLASVAPYAATFTIAQLVGFLTPAFVNVVYPRVARAEPMEVPGLMRRALLAYVLATVPLFLFFVMEGEALVHLASRHGFYAGTGVMAGLAIGFLATGFQRLAGIRLMTSDKTRLSMQFLAVGAVVALSVTGLGVGRWGPTALAFAYALGFVIPLGLTLRAIGADALGIHWRPLLLPALKLLPAIGVMIAPLWVLRGEGVGRLMLAGGASFLGYGAMLVLLGVLPWALLRQALAPMRARLKR